MECYLDNAATTPISKSAQVAMRKAMPYGNASSSHSFGLAAKSVLEDARKTIADRIGAKPSEIIFTSGGSESNSTALNMMRKFPKKHLVISAIEHNSIRKCAKELEAQGIVTHEIPVDKNGIIPMKTFIESLLEHAGMVSIIHGNNEIGTIQDINAFGKICKEKGIIFHIDACQSFCKTPIDLTHVDMMSICSHKIHGPLGAGALFVREGIRIDSLICGEQENGRRGGTQNVPAIVGMACAAQEYTSKEIIRIAALKKKMASRLTAAIPTMEINGPTNGLPTILSVRFPGVEAETLLSHLNLKKIYASAGAACNSKSKEPSHVLSAIGKSRIASQETIRLSFGRQNTSSEMEYAADKIIESHSNLLRISNRIR